MIDWSNPSTFEQTGVHHGYSSGHGPDPEWDGTVTKAWYAKLDPGGFILPHIDRGPYYERWHIPVEPGGWYWDQEQGFITAPTEPFQVRHWVPHCVANPGPKPRVHLIIETGVELGVPDRDLELFPDLLGAHSWPTNGPSDAALLQQQVG